MKTFLFMSLFFCLLLSQQSLCYQIVKFQLPRKELLVQSYTDRNPDIRNNRFKQSSQEIILKASSFMISFLGVSTLSRGDESAPVATSPVDVSTTGKITSIAYFDIKIANYTEESIGNNRAAQGSGKLVIGLYGNDAPASVARFLDTVQSDGKTRPTFVNSQFTRIVDDTLLQIDAIPRLDIVNIAGRDEYQYAGEILTDYKPIIETNSLRHTKRGLLTRRELTAGPEFGITLGPAPALDGFHVVFGTVIDGFEVLDAIASIPTYSYQTNTGYAGKEKGFDGVLADKWFETQKSFYVGVGKAFGDKRAIDRRGKLLRRVKIIGAGTKGSKNSGQALTSLDEWDE